MTPYIVHIGRILHTFFYLTSRRFLVNSVCFVVCVILSAVYSTTVSAQVTSPANINGGNAVGPSNIGGTTGNTQNFGSLSGLGLNQGETFTFTGQPNGAALWNGGFDFLNNQVLQFQTDNSALTANPVDYEINFSDDVYGLQFRFSGLDNGDETIVTFFRDGVPVPVTVSTYNNGIVTVPRANNIISFAGTNIDLSPSGAGFIVDGDGNVGGGGISIHGLQEGFVVNLPIGVAVDEVRFTPTGKNNGSVGNVTLIVTDFAWATPSIAVTKLDSFSQGANAESNIGDIITYTYTVTNNGNVPINTVTLSETGFSGTGTTPVPVFISGTGGATPSNLPQGETLTYTVDYAVTASDLLTGVVDNQATVQGLAGSDVAGQEISDLSDSENTGDGGAQGSLDEDDSNRTDFPTPTVFNPSIEAVKTADISGLSSPVVAGDVIDYTITITNDGDVDLSSISLNDTLTNADGAASTPTPIFISSTSGSPNGSLVVGESATYQFSYTLLQADIDSESLSNTVTANANAFTGGTVSDISDDDDDGDGNLVDDPTVTPLPGSPSINITKIANDTTEVASGQVITYTYRVTNTGNQTVSSIGLVDAHNGSGAAPLPINETLETDANAIGDSTDSTINDGIWDVLSPGDTIRFTADYTVTQQDIDTLQ